MLIIQFNRQFAYWYERLTVNKCLCCCYQTRLALQFLFSFPRLSYRLVSIVQIQFSNFFRFFFFRRVVITKIGCYGWVADCDVDHSLSKSLWIEACSLLLSFCNSSFRYDFFPISIFKWYGCKFSPNISHQSFTVSD